MMIKLKISLLKFLLPLVIIFSFSSRGTVIEASVEKTTAIPAGLTTKYRADYTSCTPDVNTGTITYYAPGQKNWVPCNGQKYEGNGMDMNQMSVFYINNEGDTDIPVTLVTADQNGKQPVTVHGIAHVARSCSVEVNTSPKIPELNPGDTPNNVSITSSGTGYGYLTFKPDASDNNGGLLKGSDGSSLSYSVVDSSSSSVTNWDVGSAQWSGNLTKNYSVRIDPISKSTKAGLYQGIMNVIISCE